MMIVFVIALAAICVYKIKFSSFHDDYMSIPATNSIKGIFAVIILFSHLRSYITLTPNLGNKIFIIFLNILGQLMVTMFFFYSGFGIMESWRNKENYYKGFLRKRVLKTLVHFDIAVLLFLMVGLLIGKTYPWQNYAFCWIGWESIGNSNWFIFVILILYVVTFISMKLATLKKGKEQVVLIISVCLMSVVLWVTLFFTKSSIWCNTLLCYPIGMLYSLIKSKIDDIVQSNKYIYYFLLAITSVVFGALYLMRGNVVVYSVMACAFVVLVTLITIKVQLNNKVLRWLGKYAFSIYILQRLPMILLKHLGLAENLWLFSTVSIAATLFVAFAYQKCTDLVDKRLFN
ncbi:MAG: acyltransferase family protein [Clostridia bacterium]|nr:acyltransferase family protein [Clostridia bacterium]